MSSPYLIYDDFWLNGWTRLLGDASASGPASVSAAVVRDRARPAAANGAANVSATVVRVFGAASISGSATVGATPGQTSLLDAFNRANESPLSGGGTWVNLATYLPSSSRIRLSSNAVIGVSSESCAAGWVASGAFTDSEASITLNALNGGGNYVRMGVMARAAVSTVSTTAAWRGYAAVAKTKAPAIPGNQVVELLRIDPAVIPNTTEPVVTVLASATLSVSAGDKIAIVCDGTLIEAWLFHGGSWSLAASATDSTYSSGYSGVFATSVGPIGDNFSGGIPNLVVRDRARPAAANGAANVSATVVRDRALAVAVSGSATVTAAIPQTRTLTAAVAGAAAVSGAVVRVRARPAAATGAASASADVVRVRTFSAAIAGQATVAATDVRDRARTATANAVATVSAGVVRLRPLTGTADGIATVAASPVRDRALTAAANGSASVSGTVEDVAGPSAPPTTPTEDGGNRLFSSPTPRRKPPARPRPRVTRPQFVPLRPIPMTLRLPAETAGAATVSAGIGRTRQIAAAITAQAAVAATLAADRGLAAAIEGSADVAARLARTRTLTVTADGHSDMLAGLATQRPTRDLDAEFADLLRETLILCEA